MKFKQKNKKSKTYLKFDEDDRKTYLLGFRKRKLERKEKAKLEIIEVKKKEKREIKKKRMEMVQDMINGQETDSESDEDNTYVSFSTLKTTDSVSEICGDSTVQVSGLSLESKMHIGINAKRQNDPKKQDGRKIKASFTKLKLPSSLSNKSLKSAIWKSATKDAVKNFKVEKRKKKNKKSKKKVMVTEL